MCRVCNITPAADVYGCCGFECYIKLPEDSRGGGFGGFDGGFGSVAAGGFGAAPAPGGFGAAAGGFGAGAGGFGGAPAGAYQYTPTTAAVAATAAAMAAAAVEAEGDIAAGEEMYEVMDGAPTATVAAAATNALEPVTNNDAGAPTPTMNPKEDYSKLGRLKLVKECKDRGLDYKSASSDAEALRRLLVASDLPEASLGRSICTHARTPRACMRAHHAVHLSE